MYIMDTADLMNKAVQFHGHSCPGLALGVLVSKYILENKNEFSIDEELVAVVENDNCSVDAIQALLGTTFGKGNFVFRDYGKNSYTFYNRTHKRAVRLSIKNNSWRENDLSREEKTDLLLHSKPEDIFSIREVEYNPPDYAEIHDSIMCARCHEPTMATRLFEHDHEKLCIPCYEEVTNKTAVE